MSTDITRYKLSKKQVQTFRSSLLDWYDVKKRDLPWRAKSGQIPDPYRVWLSEVMLQQTTVGAVIPYFKKFVDKWPCVQDLARADLNQVMDEWAGLGYYSRARNLHKAANVVDGELSGIFPHDQKALKALPGVGDYISAAVRSIAFDLPATVVDGNVERVIARHNCVEKPMPDSKKLLKEIAHFISVDQTDRPGDFAQAMMDLGATICTPKSPSCGQCPLHSTCKALKAGLAEKLPNKIKKAANPQKRGHVYWIENEKGEVLLERRGESGMLARMVGFPTSNWLAIEQDRPEHDLAFIASKSVKPQPLPVSIVHSFTHFDIMLGGHKLIINSNEFQPIENKELFWLDIESLQKTKFPTLFKKFYNFMV